MSFLQLAYIVAIRRTVSGWKMELVLLLGMILAVALMSGGVVFSNLLQETTLQRVLDQTTPEQANFSIRTYNALEDPSLVSDQTSTYRNSLNIVDRYVSDPLESYIQDQSFLFETQSFFFKGHPELELDDAIRPRGKINYMSNILPNHARITAGHWPYLYTDGATVSTDQPLEVAIDVLGAELLQLEVGEEMEIIPALEGQSPLSMNVKVVGHFQRFDEDEEFWYGLRRTFSHIEDEVVVVRLFTTEDAILEYVGRTYPGSHTNSRWFFYLDRSQIESRDVDSVLNVIPQIKDDVRLRLSNSTTTINLDRVLNEYQQQILLARVPFFLMISLIFGILVYYLALVSSLVVKFRSAETSMLKSRGTTTLQIGILAFLEGLLLAIPAVVLGPLIALVVSGTLANVFVYGAESEMSISPTLSLQAFLIGAGEALLAVIVLTVSTLTAARQGMVEFRQSGARPPRTPFIHRKYLDILALVLIGLIWWQMQTRGSFLVRSSVTDELRVDASLLLGPLLGLVAIGLLIIRIFPLFVTILATAMESIGSVWLVQGLRRVSRDPIMSGALVVLLMLTTSLGLIGSTFSSSLERSQKDRALYNAGADIRIQHGLGSSPVQTLGLSPLGEQIDGVDTMSEVHRSTGRLSMGGFDGVDVSILAVDTNNFTKTAWYREDFVGEKSMSELTSAIGDDYALSFLNEGIILPDDATDLAIWVNPGTVDRNSSLIGRFQDARGYYFDVMIGTLNFKEWRRLEGSLDPMAPRSRGFRTWYTADSARMANTTTPLTLLSLRVASNSGTRGAGAIFISRLSVITHHGEEIIDDFESIDRWNVVEDYSDPGRYIFESSEAVIRPDTSRSAVLSWMPGGMSLPSIRPGNPETPIQAIVSKSLLDLSGNHLGDTMTIGTLAADLQFNPVVSADYFPTLIPKEEHFVVVDLKALVHYNNLHGNSLFGGSNELWVSMDDAATDIDASEIVEYLQGFGIKSGRTYVASEMISQRVEQPMVSAGWGGLMVLMFFALVLASASGIMLFSYTDTKERQTEFALLRTLGFSKMQLNCVVWFNLLLVVICGIALGTWAGQQIGTSILPILEVSDEGMRMTPPMVLQINWVVLAFTYLILGIVAVITVIWMAWLTARLDIQRVLRIGEV